MRRLEQLIDTARKLTQNTRYDSDSGIPQDVFVQFFNNANDYLLMQVVNLKTKYLQKNVTTQIVNSQIKYDYPRDIYMQNIDTIQWSQLADNQDYFTTLFKSYTKEKVSNQNGYAFAYTPKEDGIYLNPPLQNGSLSIDYIRRVNSLGLRAGQVSSVTVSGSGVLSALTVTGGTDADINAYNYLCVVDKDGKTKALNIAYTSVSSGVFTLSPFQLASGESVAVGDYIVLGQFMTNRPEWPDVVESFLITYVKYDVKFHDGSTWTKAAMDDMQMRFKLLSESFATPSDDIPQIPITNLDYLALI